MLKPEMVPDEVWMAARLELVDGPLREDMEDRYRHALAAALNAWPGAFRNDMEEAAGVRRRIILPLPASRRTAMTSESDAEFLDGLIGRPITVSDRVRLFALARRGAAVPPAFVDTCMFPHCGHTAKGQCAPLHSPIRRAER